MVADLINPLTSLRCEELKRKFHTKTKLNQPPFFYKIYYERGMYISIGAMI